MNLTSQSNHQLEQPRTILDALTAGSQSESMPLTDAAFSPTEFRPLIVDSLSNAICITMFCLGAGSCATVQNQMTTSESELLRSVALEIEACCRSVITVLDENVPETAKLHSMSDQLKATINQI